MRHLILVIFALSTTACSATFLVPANRFEIPETNGKSFQGEIKGGIAGTGQVQVADDLTASTPNTTPLLSKNSSVYLGDGSGDSTGINVGFRWGKNFFFQPEVSYINMDWTREKPTPLKADSLSPIVFGAVIGGAW